MTPTIAVFILGVSVGALATTTVVGAVTVWQLARDGVRFLYRRAHPLPEKPLPMQRSAVRILTKENVL